MDRQALAAVPDPDRLPSPSASGASYVPRHFVHPGLSLWQLLAIVWAWRKVTVAVVAGALLLSMAAYKLLPKTYTATATLMVNYEIYDPLGGNEFPTGLLGSYMATQIELMHSSEVLLEVVRRLGLNKDERYIAGFDGSPDRLDEWVKSRLARDLVIEQGRFGWANPLVWGPFAVGAVCLVAFVAWERRAPDPMLPPRLFRVRNFAWGNLATAAIYGALYFGGFVVTLFLQQVGGYSATAAGLAQLPVTLVLLALSTRFGALAGRYGPRLFMTLGPIVGGAGYLLLLTTTDDAVYVTQVLPGLVLFGVGLAMTVAPLTSAILGSIPAADAGIGSAVNNAVSRVAGLVVIAFAGVIVGGVLDLDGFHRSLVVTAALLVLGGVLSWVGIRNEHVRATQARAEGS